MNHAALPSRLLVRLDGEIARTRAPLGQACLQAERAAYLARLGHLAPARQAIDDLRARFGQAPQVALSAWLNLAQGLCDFYSDLAPSALDRVQRALALSAAAGLRPLQALCTAWMAHLEMNRRDDAASAGHVGQALALAAPDDHATRARAALVVAHSFHQAGRPDRAQPWYGAARRHAGAAGDDATLSALLHNQAWCRLADARAAALFDAAGGDTRQAQLGADSSMHFDAGVGAASLDTLPALLRGHLWVLEGRPAQALALFEQCLEPSLAQGQGPWRACYLADMAWCHARLGHADAARRRFEEAKASIAEVPHTHDRAQALAQLARTCGALGDTTTMAAHWHDEALRERQVHLAQSLRLVVLLDAALAAAGVATAP